MPETSPAQLVRDALEPMRHHNQIARAQLEYLDRAEDEDAAALELFERMKAVARKLAKAMNEQKE